MGFHLRRIQCFSQYIQHVEWVFTASRINHSYTCLVAKSFLKLQFRLCALLCLVFFCFVWECLSSETRRQMEFPAQDKWSELLISFRFVTSCIGLGRKRRRHEKPGLTMMAWTRGLLQGEGWQCVKIPDFYSPLFVMKKCFLTNQLELFSQTDQSYPEKKS